MPDTAFITVMRRHLKYLKPNEELDLDSELKAMGLNSMAAVDLLLDIEDEYGIGLPDQYLTADTFSTARSLWTVIDTLRAES